MATAADSQHGSCSAVEQNGAGDEQAARPLYDLYISKVPVHSLGQLAAFSLHERSTKNAHHVKRHVGERRVRPEHGGRRANRSRKEQRAVRQPHRHGRRRRLRVRVRVQCRRRTSWSQTGRLRANACGHTGLCRQATSCRAATLTSALCIQRGMPGRAPTAARAGKSAAAAQRHAGNACTQGTSRSA